MSDKLSDRLEAEIDFWPKTGSLVRALRDAIEVVKAWEDAPVGTVDYDAHPFLTVDDADLPENWQGRRVKLVEVVDG